MENKYVREFPEDIQKRIADRFSGVGKGWLPIVTELHEKLVKADPDYTIGQIKEKFGSLRFYAHGNFTEEEDKLISDAERKSAVTCEVCGEPGEIKASNGCWLRCLCEYHHKEVEERQRAIDNA